MEGLQSLSYVGEETIDGTRCHHISAVEESITWNVWITVGDLLPREIVATATSIEGQAFSILDVGKMIDVKPERYGGIMYSPSRVC